MSSERSLPSPAPTPGPDTQRFWDALAAGGLILPVCDACHFVIWYPRELCPRCWSTEVTWTKASGRGHIHSSTIVRRGVGAYADHEPYVVAYVDLIEGPRVLANILGGDDVAPAIGAPVTLDTSPAGRALLRFRLKPSDTPTG